MTITLLISLVVTGMTLAGNTFAQAFPATDLWLAKIENGVPASPVKISKGDGYNNQPPGHQYEKWPNCTG